MCDLAKHTGAIARLKAGGGRRGGGADSWAPPHGPVRPLVQLMSVLPPRRCASLPSHACVSARGLPGITPVSDACWVVLVGTISGVLLDVHQQDGQAWQRLQGLQSVWPAGLGTA